jgi:hypothetical protein
MKPFLRFAAALFLVLLVGAVVAAPSPVAEREIDQLITALGTSGCEFQRNGSWHSAAKAQAHLRKKYAWLRKRDLVHTAEQFIELAGSKSSLTGRAYEVRCSGRPVVASAVWLRARLAQIRRTAPSR